METDRTIPSLDNGAPQIRISPNLIDLARAGVSVRELASTVDVFNDGANVIQIPIRGELIDMVLSGKDARKLTAAALSDIPVVTGAGNVLRLDQLATVEIISAPEQIRRLGGRQSLSLQLRPNEAVPLEQAVQIIEDEILTGLRADASAAGVTIAVKGAASALEETWTAMQSNVATAIAVIFLLLVVILRNFVLPVIIRWQYRCGRARRAGLEHLYRQPLDMVTMLGFVILTGVVVNTILMIEQAMLHMREEDGCRCRHYRGDLQPDKPIFMSTLTSAVWSGPAGDFSGAGSELYRGLQRRFWRSACPPLPR